MSIEDRTESLVHAAKLLGIDPVREPQYLWVAKLASQASIDPEWKEFTDELGRTQYFNSRTKNIQQIHPVLEKYSQLLAKQKSFTNSLKVSPTFTDTETSEVISELIRTVNDRIGKGMTPTTPAIIEKLATLLHVDPRKEYQLIRCIKLTFELYIEKRFNLTSFISDTLPSMHLLRKAFSAQIKEDIVFQNPTIILCQECEQKSAIYQCTSCEDFFCQICFTNLHATGNRRFHVTIEVEQLVCIACDRSVASSHCAQCGTFYCATCYDAIHAARAELNHHLKRPISGLICLECEHLSATALCEDCLDLFCDACFVKQHNNGRRRLHSRLSVDAGAGQLLRGGSVVPEDEARQLIEACRIFNQGPLLEFSDDGGKKFSFNLSTLEIKY